MTNVAEASPRSSTDAEAASTVAIAPNNSVDETEEEEESKVHNLRPRRLPTVAVEPEADPPAKRRKRTATLPRLRAGKESSNGGPALVAATHDEVVNNPFVWITARQQEGFCHAYQWVDAKTISILKRVGMHEMQSRAMELMAEHGMPPSHAESVQGLFDLQWWPAAQEHVLWKVMREVYASMRASLEKMCNTRHPAGSVVGWGEFAWALFGWMSARDGQGVGHCGAGCPLHQPHSVPSS